MELNITPVTNDEPEITKEDLIAWSKLKVDLAVVKEKEMALRKRIYSAYFVGAKEGTNKHQLANDYILKAVRVVDRKVEIGTLQALAVDGGQLQQHGINANELIEWKPELKIAEYRKLTPEQVRVFDQALIIKDGSPQMEIVLPASAKKK